MDIPNRSNSPEEKRQSINSLLEAWQSIPSQRLGQLLSNVVALHHKDLFYIEDKDLIEMVESFIRTYSKI